MSINRLIAFARRDFLIFKSYKLLFILNCGGIFTTTLTFYFISRLFGGTVNNYIAEYSTGYFPFVIIGIAFSSYLQTSLNSFSHNLRTEQITGTLEMLFVTPVRVRELIVGMSLWQFVFSSFRVAMFFLLAFLFLGLRMDDINLLSAFTVTLFTVLSFSCVSIIMAAVIIVFKKVPPLTWFVGTFSGFFGGAYFPVDILPEPLRTVSCALPITYSLRAFRYAALKGYSLWQIRGDLGVLMAYSVILLPVSIFIFKAALKKAKNNGTLSHY